MSKVPELRPIPGVADRYGMAADGTVWSCATRSGTRSESWAPLRRGDGRVWATAPDGGRARIHVATMQRQLWPDSDNGWIPLTAPGYEGYEVHATEMRVRSWRTPGGERRPQPADLAMKSARSFVLRINGRPMARIIDELRAEAADPSLAPARVARFGPSNEVENLHGLDVESLATALAERVPRIYLNVTRAAPAQDLSDAVRALRGLQARIEDFASCVSGQVLTALDRLPSVDVGALADAVAARLPDTGGPRRGSGQAVELTFSEHMVNAVLGAMGRTPTALAGLLGVKVSVVDRCANGTGTIHDETALARLEWLFVHARRHALDWDETDDRQFRRILDGERKAHLEVAAWGER